MSIDTRIDLKKYFEYDDQPTDVQFANLIDSFWHKTDDTIDWTNVGGKPLYFAPSAHFHAWIDITGKPVFATVATSGAYNDLTGIPSTFAPSVHAHAWADITSKPSTFSPSAHVHSAGEITTGLFHPSRMGAGTTTDGYMIQLVAGVPTWVVAPSGGGSGWGLTGNAGTTAGTSYIGTSDNVNFEIRSNALRQARFYAATYGVALGEQATATGNWGFSAGLQAGASGQHAMSIGYNAQANSTSSVAIGRGSTSNHGDAIVIGSNAAYTTARAGQTLIGGYDGIDFQKVAGTTLVSIGGSSGYALDVNGTARVVTVPTISTATKMLVKDPTTGQISEQLLPSGGGGGWGLSGNAISSGNRLGTTNTESLILMANSLSVARFTASGSVSFGELGTMSGASNFAAGYQAAVNGASSFALGTIAAANGTAAYAFGFNATANHSHAFIFGANAGGAVTSDAASQIKFVGLGGTRINTSNTSTAFEVLASGKIAAYGLATYASEAAGLAAEASGVIFKVGNALYHKP